MPVIKPVLNKINAFDAEQGTTLTFSWTGPQARKNRIVIREYDSPHRIVYDCTQETMALKHVLHLGEILESGVSQAVPYALENGKRYLASLQIFDTYNNESETSNEAAFYCFAAPVFRFTNFTNVDTATSIAKVTFHSIYLNVKYAQEDGEVLSEYKFRLYDYTGKLLLESGTFYGSTADDELQYTLGGVTDTAKDEFGGIQYQTCYRIVCQGVTVHGMNIQTEQKFVVHKDTGGVGALVTAQSLPDCTIAVSSHFKIVNADFSGQEEHYLLDENQKPYAIDLTGGDTIRYFEGFQMKPPYSLTAIGRAFVPGEILLSCAGPAGEAFAVSYHEKRYSLISKAYFLLEIRKGAIRYLLRSGYFPIQDLWYIIHIRNEKGFYTFRVLPQNEMAQEQFLSGNNAPGIPMCSIGKNRTKKGGLTA